MSSFSTCVVHFSCVSTKNNYWIHFMKLFKTALFILLIILATITFAKHFPAKSDTPLIQTKMPPVIYDNSTNKKLKHNLHLNSIRLHQYDNNIHSNAKPAIHKTQSNGNVTMHNEQRIRGIENNGHILTPQKHLYFIHVAKTGGTTMTNIIARFALDYNLSVPCFYGKYLFSWPDPDTVGHVVKENNNTRHYDVMYQHTVLNITAKRILLPEDVFVFTMLRHPLAQLKSLFKFSKIDQKLNIFGKNPLGAFLAHPRGNDCNVFLFMSMFTPGNQSPVYLRRGSLLQDGHRSTVQKTCICL